MKNSILKTSLLLIATSICAIVLTSCNEKHSYNLSISSQTEHGKVFLTKTTAKEGEKVRLACLPDAGYRLVDYVVDGKNIESSSFTMPDKDVEISANFEIIQYTISYVLNGGTVAEGNPTTYNIESGDINLIPPTKEGFEFGNWYYYFAQSDELYADPETYKVEKIASGTTGKLTLYARYYNVPHNIDIDENMIGKIEIYPDNYMVEVGEVVTLDYTMMNESYYFAGYIVDGKEIEGNSFIMPNHDVIISAKLEPVKYIITYMLEGGINSPNNPYSYTVEDEEIILEDAEKEGYIFLGWYYIDEINGQVWISSIYGGYARDYTLYAYFEPIESETLIE